MSNLDERVRCLVTPTCGSALRDRVQVKGTSIVIYSRNAITDAQRERNDKLLQLFKRYSITKDRQVLDDIIQMTLTYCHDKLRIMSSRFHYFTKVFHKFQRSTLGDAIDYTGKLERKLTSQGQEAELIALLHNYVRVLHVHTPVEGVSITPHQVLKLSLASSYLYNSKTFTNWCTKNRQSDLIHLLQKFSEPIRACHYISDYVSSPKRRHLVLDCKIVYEMFEQ